MITAVNSAQAVANLKSKKVKIMASVWFLVVTLCTVNPGAMASDCDDYVIDGDLSYTDCIQSIAQFPEKAALFSISCKRGEPLDGVGGEK